MKRGLIFQCCGRRSKSALWAALPFAMLLAIALPARAGLGDDETSVQADQARMQGSLRSTQTQAYTVHEIRAATGTVVREYVSSGKVFAVAWQGTWPPDMRHVLASHFDEYQQAVQTQASGLAGRRPLYIDLPGLVVQSSGHMRSFAGRAYVPELLPSGVSKEEIR